MTDHSRKLEPETQAAFCGTAVAWDAALDTFQQSLWTGDLMDAEEAGLAAFRISRDLPAILEEFITPSLHRVGDLWAAGELTVADEHLATEVALRVMVALFAHADERRFGAELRRCVLTATLEGEQHGVGVRMASDLLELAGHEVVNCGVDTPLDDLVELAVSSRVDAIAISVTMPSSEATLREVAARVWERLPGLPLLVGGQGLPSDLPEGKFTRIDRLDDLVAVVDGLPSRLAVPAPPVRRRTSEPSAQLVDLPTEATEDLDSPVPTAAHLRAIFRGSADAIVAFDRLGVITALNPAAEALFDRRMTMSTRARAADLVGAPELAYTVRQGVRAALDGGTVEGREWFVPLGGSGRLLDLCFVPVPEAEGIVGAALIVREVAEREGAGGKGGSGVWHRRIEHALAEDRFVLAAQPIVDLATDQIDHYELLLRLRMGGKLVMPAEFIAPAERSGQITEIDRWVIERGLELAHSYPVAINLSGASLGVGSLTDIVSTTADRLDVDPTRITFEITETAAAENLDLAQDLVVRMRELGCRVALDDFGTGFGSFRYLSRLPVTELKIDNEFARGVRTGEAERQVIDAVVSVGEAFGIRTVAEGIEDEEALTILRGAGVDLGQGYFFGRPEIVDERSAA